MHTPFLWRYLHVDYPAENVEGPTLRGVLVLFVGDAQAHGRRGLSDAVAAAQTIDVMQALSGG